MIRTFVTRRRLLILSALLPLAGCALPPPGGAAASPEPAFFALGTEPGWTLEIAEGRMIYNGDYGEVRIEAPLAGARLVEAGRRYVTDTLDVAITPGPCNDGMSDRRYAARVTVVAAGRRVEGCGGAVVPPPTLVGTQWRLLAIDDRPALADPPATLAFEAGRLSGTTGCNRFTGTWSGSARAFTAGPLALTRMGCPPALMAQEAAVTSRLEGAVTVRFAPDGAMTLTRPDGTSLRWRQLI